VVGVSLLILVTLAGAKRVLGHCHPDHVGAHGPGFYLYGYTLNRITLFALIFSIGILVDDAIVVVENIVRHFHLPQNKGRNWSSIAGGGERSRQRDHPGHFAVIAAVLPMAFVGGLSGPHMTHSARGRRGDVLLAGHRLRGHAVGFDSHLALGQNTLADRGTARSSRAAEPLPFEHGRTSSPAFTAAS
jgi:hypothetical protein